MNQIKAALMTLLLASCGEGSDDTCGPRTGLYRFTMERRTGGCDSGGESVVNFDDASNGDGCVSRKVADALACRSEVDITCTTDKPGLTYTTVGVIDWTSGGNVGTGLLSISFTGASGGNVCQGTYNVRYTKL